MTDTPHSGSAGRPVPQAIPTAAEALARLGMPLLEAMLTQRAVRRVLPDPVDDEVVLKCIELALRAPTGSNGQNWEFVVVEDRRVRRSSPSAIGRPGRWHSRRNTVRGRPGAVSAGASLPNDEPMTKLLRAVQWQVNHFAWSPYRCGA